jgi:hypothetical protein
MVYANSPVESVQFVVDRVSSVPLDVTVLLDGADSDVSSDSIVGLANTRHCLTVVASRSHLWRVVRFVASNVHHARLLLDIAATAVVPSLTSFSIIIPSAMYRSPSPSDAPFFFNILTPSLVTLDQYGVCFPWDGLNCFTSLKKLRLRNTPSHLWPSAPQFASALTASASLMHLTIHGSFHLTALDLYHPISFTLAFLVTLDLNMTQWPYQADVATFLCSMELPSLQHLSLAHLDDRCRLVLFEGQFAATVPSLAVVGFDMFTDVLANFLLGFTRLRVLDLKSATVSYLDALFANDSAYPDLRDLTVGNAPLQELYLYLTNRRANSMPITRLVIDNDYFDALDEKDVEYLRLINLLVPQLVTPLLTLLV